METKESVRWLRGGELGNGEPLVEGPAHRRGYSTPALGWADTINVAPSEVAALVTPGGPYTFCGYLVGTRESVAACLRAAIEGEKEPPVPFTGSGSWKELLAIREQLFDAARKLGVEFPC